MVKIYVRRVRAGLMTLGDVPERWRDAVRRTLGDEGADEAACGKHFA